MNKWYINDGDLCDDIVSSRVRIARNIKGFPFPNMMTDEQKYMLIQKVSDAIFNLEVKDEFKFVDINKLNEYERFSMVERHIISVEFANDNSGRALIINNDESLSIMINEEDHIRIQSFSTGLELYKALEKAKKVEKIIEESLEFAYNDDFGFLTVCPTNVGTGLRASVMMHLPVLEQMSVLDNMFNSISKFGLTVRGTFGEGTKTKSSLYQISNQITLGSTENELIENLERIVRQILDREHQARKNIDSIELKDKLSRSLGQLKHAVLLSSNEMLSRLSDVRLGTSLSYFDVSVSTINELMFTLGSAGVKSSLKQDLDDVSRDQKRAELIRKAL